MNGVLIKDLPISASPSKDDKFVIVQGEETKQIDLESLFKESNEGIQAVKDLFMSGKILDNPHFNIAVLDTVRNGVKCQEVWLLINAKYDYESKRFKRVNVNNFSFGWQMQGGGTYPGEENIGDLTNQGMNLWKANGKLAYGVNDPAREQTNEDIGALQSDGSWREFGIMLGWNNVFMNDSYGGMTIGGSGFEIDGSGTSPFKRVSLGKFSGGSSDSNKKPQDYVFAYNGTCWNTQHGLFNMDVKETDSYYWGMEAPINWYDNPNKTFDPYSNRADLTKTKYVIKRLPANMDSKFENWKNVFEIDLQKEEGKIGRKDIITNTRVKCGMVNGNFNANYPDSTWNKENTIIVAIKAIQKDKTVKQIINVNPTLTEYGIIGWIGDDFESVDIIISKITV